MMTSASFHRLAEETILHRVSNRGRHTSLRRFISCFGCSPRIVAHLWKRIVSKDLAPKGMRPQHLLWSLLFLKNYNTEDFLAPICGTNAKTYRKWIWSCIDVLNDLDLVSRLSSRIVSMCHEGFSSIDRGSRPTVRAPTSTSNAIAFFVLLLLSTDQVGQPLHERQGLHLFGDL